MRISSTNLYASTVSTMNQQEAQIAQLEQQISSGQAILSPSDDPVGAATQVTLNQQIQLNKNFTSNRAAAEATLNNTGTALSAMTNVLTNIKTSLTSAGNGSYTDAERRTVATQLQTQMNELVAYANSQDSNGEYLFSGWQSNTPPFAMGNSVVSTAAAANAGNGTLSAGTAPLASAFPGNASVTISSTPTQNSNGTLSFQYTVSGLPNPAQNGTFSTSNSQVVVGGSTLTMSGSPKNGDGFNLSPSPVIFQGDNGTHSVEVSPGQQMTVNVNGTLLFQSVATGNGQFATAADARNQGTGLIDSGHLVGNVPVGKTPYALVFSGTAAVTAGPGNLGNVGVGPGNVSGNFSGSDQYRLQFSVDGSGVTTYSVLDASTGTTLSSANPYTSGQAITVAGATFSPTGKPMAGDSLLIGPGPASTYTVLDNSTTPATAVLSNQSFVAGGQIQIPNTGMSFSISGAPAANDQFTIQPSTTTSVFTVLQQAIAALNAPSDNATQHTQLANALNTAQNGVDAALGQIDIGQTLVGGRSNELSALDTSQAAVKTQLQASLARISNTDEVAAISDLTQAQTALQAAQKTFVTVQGLSLFNYLK